MKIKLTNPNAKVPTRANPTDAGADLFSPITEWIESGRCRFIDFGIQLEIPTGSTGLIFARSGLGGQGVRPRNCVGVIDSKYRGNIGMMVENSNSEDWLINKGDRIAQLVIVPIYMASFEVVDELDMTGDRNGGFGSSGR